MQNALNYASEHGFLDIVKTIVEYGVPRSLINFVSLIKALQKTAAGNQVKVAEFLLDRGASIESRSKPYSAMTVVDILLMLYACFSLEGLILMVSLPRSTFI